MQGVRGPKCNNHIPGSICISQPGRALSWNPSATQTPSCHYLRLIIGRSTSTRSCPQCWGMKSAGFLDTLLHLSFHWVFLYLSFPAEFKVITLTGAVTKGVGWNHLGPRCHLCWLRRKRSILSKQGWVLKKWQILAWKEQNTGKDLPGEYPEINWSHWSAKPPWNIWFIPQKVGLGLTTTLFC